MLALAAASRAATITPGDLSFTTSSASGNILGVQWNGVEILQGRRMGLLTFPDGADAVFLASDADREQVQSNSIHFEGTLRHPVYPDAVVYVWERRIWNLGASILVYDRLTGISAPPRVSPFAFLNPDFSGGAIPGDRRAWNRATDSNDTREASACFPGPRPGSPCVSLVFGPGLPAQVGIAEWDFARPEDVLLFWDVWAHNAIGGPGSHADWEYNDNALALVFDPVFLARDQSAEWLYEIRFTPEPGTLVLVGAGLVAFAVAKRRSRGALQDFYDSRESSWHPCAFIEVGGQKKRCWSKRSKRPPRSHSGRSGAARCIASSARIACPPRCWSTSGARASSPARSACAAHPAWSPGVCWRSGTPPKCRYRL